MRAYIFTSQSHSLLFIFSLYLLILLESQLVFCENDELRALMELKNSLDPDNRVLTSWTSEGKPCRGDLLGVACNELGNVANISLQGKELSGFISPAIAELKGLTGLYLHYNAITGVIPREIARLSQLTDLYLNVNNLSGGIPEEIGNMAGLQVLQLSYNKLTGSIPTQLGLVKQLGVLNLQSNQLNGAIPASLGDLNQLKWLDLSYNQFFGSIPVKLAQIPNLAVLDVRNNSLSGNVPIGLRKLGEDFKYENNKDLCGTGFIALRACTSADELNPNRPQPLGAGLNPRAIPQSVNIDGNCNTTSCTKPAKTHALTTVVSVSVVAFIAMVSGLVAYAWYRYKKQRNKEPAETIDRRASLDEGKNSFRKPASPLINLEYSNGWDPLSDGRSGAGFSEEVSQSLRFNLEEVESATQYFSEVNLLEKKSNFALTYKGTLRDGTEVAIKRINKTSCKSEEAGFLKGLKVLTMLRHENLVRLKGFCCSRGRGECFLVYDFISNGSLAQYMDVKDDGSNKVLNWYTRLSIIKGIAKGIEYLHSNRTNKPILVHQSLSAEKILIDDNFKPLLSSPCLHKLLAEDVVFSSLKASAAMGYLAPEYTTVGRFSEKSDIYAFGIIIFQILTGKKMINHLRLEAESGKLEDLIDENLKDNYSKPEAAKLAGIALLCTSEVPSQRPSIDLVVQELNNSH